MVKLDTPSNDAMKLWTTQNGGISIESLARSSKKLSTSSVAKPSGDLDKNSDMENHTRNDT